MHGFIHEINDALSSFHLVHAHLLGNRLNGSGGRSDIELELTAEEFGRQITESKIRVCYRGLGTSLAVRCRSRSGAAGLRAHAEVLGKLVVDGYRTASSAHGSDINRRRAHR